MSATMANQNFSPQRVAETITAMQSMLESGLSVIDQMNGMQLDITGPQISANGNLTPTPGTGQPGTVPGH
jgi:hypothetical protein